VIRGVEASLKRWEMDFLLEPTLGDQWTDPGERVRSQVGLMKRPGVVATQRKGGFDE
jgi:hypothetical protein